MKTLCIPENFSVNLRDMRLIAGLSQTELGELLGYGQNHICYWEKGKVFPGIEALMKMSACFDVTLDSLLYYPNTAKGRCNAVCLHLKKIIRAEKLIENKEMLEWRMVKNRIIEFMEIQDPESRRGYLEILKKFVDDLYLLAITEIIKSKPSNMGG